MGKPNKGLGESATGSPVCSEASKLGFGKGSGPGGCVQSPTGSQSGSLWKPHLERWGPLDCGEEGPSSSSSVVAA